MNNYKGLGIVIELHSGMPGSTGKKGDKPSHEWEGTSLRFENPDGSFGNFIDLKGEKGDTGAQGSTGEQGIQGIQGIQGEQGVQGIKGDIGPKGDTGDIGPKGDKGDKGDTGDIGPKGDKGDKGDTGEQGIQGIQGIQGEQGVQGIKGDKGDTGEITVEEWNTTTKTLTLSDSNKLFICSSSGNQTLTIPTNATVAFPIGTMITFTLNISDKITFVGASGVTLKSIDSLVELATENGMASLIKIFENTWQLVGALE